METNAPPRKSYRDAGIIAYKSCGNPITHIDLMMFDILRMPEDGVITQTEYRDQLLGGFRAAAEEAGDRTTVEYVDTILAGSL